MSVNSELDKVCRILDKLTLDSLTLMQEEIILKLNAENAMSDGETHLAKSRYILGQNKVSELQLPTENGNEFKALVNVHVSDDEYLGEKSYTIESTKISEDDPEYQNPLKWFGLLVPQSLNHAQIMYRQALQWLIKTANVQNRLNTVCETIEMLKNYKESLKKKELETNCIHANEQEEKCLKPDKEEKDLKA